MATAPQLVKAISEVTGVPLPTVTDIDRKLVVSGLRAKRGRGRSAGHMTALDASTLLSAILAVSQANAAAEAAQRYLKTEADKARSSEGLFAQTGFEDLASLPAQHSFVDALEALIISASVGAMAKLIAESNDGWTPRIEVFAFTRATYGRIRISGLPNGMTANVEYLPSPDPKVRRAKAGAVEAENTGDLEQSRRVTERTILSIADLLAGEPK